VPGHVLVDLGVLERALSPLLLYGSRLHMLCNSWRALTIAARAASAEDNS
jgi:hypothetical protein